MTLLAAQPIPVYKWTKTLLVFLLVIAIALTLQVSTASAGAESTTCIGNGGSWSGTIPSDIGVCTYAAGSVTALTHCTSAYDYVVTFAGTSSASCVLASVESDSAQPSGPASLGKCKLVSIDTPVKLSSDFHATWIGRLDSIRFRQAGSGVHFVSATAGSHHFDDGVRAAQFSSIGLNRGRYQTSCFGEEGTFGVEKVVFIR